MTILKIKIDIEREPEFIEFLTNNSLPYRRTKYTKQLFIWSVHVEEDYNFKNLATLDYVISIAIMPMMTL